MPVEPRKRQLPGESPEPALRNELRGPVPELGDPAFPTMGAPGEILYETPLDAPVLPAEEPELVLDDELGFSRGALRAFRGGLDAAGRPAPLPIRLIEFTRAFYLGGTEAQLVELLRGLPGHYRVRVGALEAKGPLLGAVCELGLTPQTFPLGARFLRPSTAVQIARLARWLRDEHAELVHVHDFAATLIAVPAAKLAGARVVVSRLDLAHYHSPLQRAVLASLTRAADHVIVNAEAIRTQLMLEEEIPGARISLVRNGIDLPRFDRRLTEGLSQPLPETHGEPVLVHVANMNHPVKRQEDLLLALGRLRLGGRALHAFLVGDGPRRPELERLAASLQLADRVHFLGHRTDVPAILGRASMGVLCSSAEGLSNAIIEGMAARLPMVVTDVGGSAELVGHGAHGWVVPAHEPRALAAAIAEVLASPERAREAGARARAYVERELTIDQMVRSHDAVYRCVCSSQSP
jgi:glycosyltransferase involved in cell wall biosynthesis